MKQILLSFILVMATCAMSAQITTSWTSSMTPTTYIPTGVTVASADTLEDYVTLSFAIELDATTLDNDNKATAFNAIGAATKVELDSNWIEEVWALNPASDILGVYVIESIQRKWDNFEHPSLLEQYIVAEDVFYIRGKFRYIIE